MNEDLKFHIRSLSRFIYYVTDEEDRFISQIATALTKSKKRQIMVYNAAFGLVPVTSLIEDWKNHVNKEPQDPGIHNALIKIYQDNPKTDQSFYIITDPDRWLQDPMVVRRVLNLAHQLRANEKIIKITLFVGPRLVIPQKLQRYIEVVHDKGMTTEEIRTELDTICQKLNIPPTTANPKSFTGLTSYEIDAAVSQNIIAKKHDESIQSIDPKFIAEYKRRQLRKTNLVSLLDTSAWDFSQIGGLFRFKKWAEKTKANWTPEGQKFGLKPPKGVLLMGVWGCGKSISVKALGHAWRLPVVHLELGKLRQSGVGDSESNMYAAINMIESVAPCIVLVDEAEKSLGGAASSSYSDAGTTGRMIGILSTWLQETSAEICLVPTVNTLETLPIEITRRMTERFFFSLPSEEERIDILKIHLTKSSQDPSQFNLASLAEDAKNMVGSEIEQAIQLAMTDSFDAGKPALDSEILSNELKRKPRILKTMADELRELMDWVGFDPETGDGIRAKYASEPGNLRLEGHG